MRILIAEDERDLNRILTERLTRESYSVDSCFNGEEALTYATSAAYDLLILDIMMPKMNGLQVLTTLREQHDPLPVLLLTARDSVADRVRGLDAGANDYLVKPFSIEELLARIRVLLRKPHMSQTAICKVGELSLHLDTHRVYRGSQEIMLSAKEFSLLRYMMQNAGIVLSRETLEQHIWNYDFTGGSNVIDVYIRYLRKKIDDGHKTKYIQTVRGTGYVLRETS